METRSTQTYSSNTNQGKSADTDSGIRNDVTSDVKNIVAEDEKSGNEEKKSSEKTLNTIRKEKPTRHSVPAEDTQVDSTACSFRKGILLLRRRYGLVLASLLPVMFCLYSMFVYVLTDTLDSFQVVFMLTPVYMICTFLLLLYARVRPPSDYRNYIWLLGSGSVQASNTCLFVFSLIYLPVGDTVTVFYTAVIQVGFFSRIILKEPLRLFDVVFALLALAGVIFIARPPFLFRSNDQTSYVDVTIYGVLFALFGSSSLALHSVFNRKLSTLGVNSFFCMFCNSTMAVRTSGVITLILQRWRWPTVHEMVYVMLAGVSYALGHLTLFYALKVETATVVNVILTSDIILIFVLQAIFLHLLPYWTSYIGATLIFMACIGITLKSKPPPSQASTTEPPQV